MKTNTPPTLTELYAAYSYRRDERLGILCEDQPPTLEQIALAQSEADLWLKETTKPMIPATQVEMKL